MMTGSETVRWLLTAVFAAAALAAVLPLRAPAGRAGRAGAVFCLAMCAAMVAMTWLPEPAAAVWVQAAGFGCAGLWFGLGRRGGSGRFRRPSPAGLHHALMAAAMIWMLTAVPGVAGTDGTAGMAGMQPPGGGRGAMAAMTGTAAPSVPVLAISALAAACCAAASLPWLIRAVAPGLRGTDPAAAGNALMGAGMAAMLLTML